MRGLRASLVAVALLVIESSSALAEPSEDEALAHLHQGIDHFRGGNFSAAVISFEAAHELFPDKPNPYRWLALAHVQLGDCRAALENIDEFLARVSADEPRVAELKRLRKLCAAAGTGTLRVASTPAAAALQIDGVNAGTTPHTSLSMRPGDHRISVKKDGFERQTRDVVLAPGEKLELNFELAVASRPITGKWWFWAAIGGVVTVVGAGIVIAAARSTDAARLPPVECNATGCR